MKKSKKNIINTLLILIGIVILSISWFSFVNFIIPFFQYSFTGRMPLDDQQKFRDEYLKPLCKKLVQAPVKFDEGISEDERVYWMTVRYSVLPRFKSCDDFATYPTLKYGTSEFTDTSMMYATYDFGPHQSYVLSIWETGRVGNLELHGIKGLDDTPLCYGKNLNMESVLKKFMPQKTNRKIYYENLNNQCSSQL